MTPKQAWMEVEQAMFGFPIGKNGKTVDSSGPATPGPKLTPNKASGDAREVSQ